MMNIILVTQGGMYVFQLIDWYSAAIAVPLFGFLECIAFGWIYGMSIVIFKIPAKINVPRFAMHITLYTNV